MTRLLSPEVVACPVCDACLLRPRVASFNTFGSTRWSDGYQDMIVVFIAPRLAKCPSCTQPFWPEDARSLGQMPATPRPMGCLMRLVKRLAGDPGGHLAAMRARSKMPLAWHTARALIPANASDWQAILAQTDSLMPERELIARRHLWWCHNDAFRTDDAAHETAQTQPAGVALEREANLHRLLALHEGATPCDAQRLEHGEVLRNLGQFEAACAVLAQVAGQHQADALALAALADAGDPHPRVLWRSTYAG